MDGEQNIERSKSDDAAGVAASQAAAAGVDGDSAGGGNAAGSTGNSNAGADSAARAGDELAGQFGGQGPDASDAGSVAGRFDTSRIVDDGSDEITLDWKNNESDAEAAIAWSRFHAGDQHAKALRILSTLADSQELGIRNGDTPVRNNAKTAYRDVLAQIG